MTVRLRKHESFNRMMARFDRQDRKYGNVRDIMRDDRRFHMGPRKKRQLKSENARKRQRAIKRRMHRRNRIRKSRNAHRMF